MSGLHHPNIVLLIGCVWEPDLLALVMEFADLGTSTDLLARAGTEFTWDDPLLKWCVDIARGMKYLNGVHYNDAITKERVEGIIHRDLKPDNALVNDSYAIKVSKEGGGVGEEYLV